MDEQKKNNTPDDKKELSLGEKLKLAQNIRPCRCGRSKKYPYCDGSHNAS